MINKHLRDEFEAIPEVNERLKWLGDKNRKGEIGRIDALMLAWEDGAKTTVGDRVIVVDICECEAESVQELSRLEASAYIDGFGTGANLYGAGSAGSYIWPDDSEDLHEEERESAEIAVAEYLARKTAADRDPS